MKNFIQLFSLLILFSLTSCSLENEVYNTDKQGVVVAEKTFKTAVVTYDFDTDITSKEDLLASLNIQKTFEQRNNIEVWLLKTNDSAAILEDLIALSDGVIDVQISEGETMYNDLEKGMKEDKPTNSDQEKGDSGTDDESTNSDQEKGDSGTDDESTNSDQEKGDSGTDDESTNSDQEKGDSGTDDESTNSDQEKDDSGTDDESTNSDQE